MGPLSPKGMTINSHSPFVERKLFVFVLLVHRNLVIAAGQVYGAKVSRPSHVIDDFREFTRGEGIISCFSIEGSVIYAQSERAIRFTY